jgi:hypothetical protein
VKPNRRLFEQLERGGVVVHQETVGGGDARLSGNRCIRQIHCLTRGDHRRHVVDVACRVQLDDIGADDNRIAGPDLAKRVEQLPGRQSARLVV